MEIKKRLMEDFKGGDLEREVEPRFLLRVNLQRSMEPSGAEISALWRGYRSREFVPHAKELGISNEIYRIVIKKAAPYMLEILRLKPEFKFALKLARLNAESFDEIEEILEVFRREGVPLRNLEFEADLSFAEEHLGGEEILKRLYTLSVTVDFAVEAGQTICLPVNLFVDVLVSKVKLKEELVKFLLGREGDFTLENRVRFFRAMVHFFKEMGISTLADGVDSKELVDLLLILGVEEAQGPYFGGYLTGEELLKRVKGA